MNVRSAVEVLGRHEERIIGNRRKGDPCYKVAKNLAKLCSSVLWEVGMMNLDI